MSCGKREARPDQKMVREANRWGQGAPLKRNRHVGFKMEDGEAGRTQE
jgi:hypothetical protein